MIWVRYYIRCGESFDIDTEKDLCPKCRNKDEVMEGEVQTSF